MKIGNKIRKIRIDKNLKQEVIADLLAISSSKYSRIESNQQEADKEVVDKICELFKLLPSDLIDESAYSFINLGTATGNSFSVHNNIDFDTNKLLKEYIELLKSENERLKSN